MYMMEVVINNELGLHARPANEFIKEASKFKAEIKVIKNNTEYNGKSIIGILSMGAIKGDTITIAAKGEDEKEAVEALVKLIASKFS